MVGKEPCLLPQSLRGGRTAGKEGKYAAGGNLRNQDARCQTLWTNVILTHKPLDSKFAARTILHGMKESRVYILGAGCSFEEERGYPLASGFLAALNAFATKIAADSQKKRILDSVQKTVDLMTRCQSGPCHASTIDQMINLIGRNQCDNNLAAIANVKSPSHLELDRLRMEAMRNAKVATAACFLDREEEARTSLVAKYRAFIEHKILNNTGPSTRTLIRIGQSEAKVLSFNYDRMFELAFFGTFNDPSLTNHYAYGPAVLNSGLEAGGEVGRFEEDRFCFIKLHGSIGFLCNEDGLGQHVLHISDVANWQPIPIWDAHFFSDQPTRHAFRDPLIVFPYEKDFVMSNSGNKLEFRQYLKTAWEHASKVVEEASEIRIIGYSFDPTDSRYLIKLLRKVKNCRQLVIQNKPFECDRIEQLLIDDQINVPLRKNTSLF